LIEHLSHRTRTNCSLEQSRACRASQTYSLSRIDRLRAGLARAQKCTKTDTVGMFRRLSSPFIATGSSQSASSIQSRPHRQVPVFVRRRQLISGYRLSRRRSPPGPAARPQSPHHTKTGCFPGRFVIQSATVLSGRPVRHGACSGAGGASAFRGHEPVRSNRRTEKLRPDASASGRASTALPCWQLSFLLRHCERSEAIRRHAEPWIASLRSQCHLSPRALRC
jgi:hypothetical protein